MHSLEIGMVFRNRLRSGERLIGSFVKTPTCHATEILGDLGYDFIVIDVEHAMLDRGAVDLMLLASLAAGIPALVRVANQDPSGILSVLDAGAAGVLVPHVTTPSEAEAVVSASRFLTGQRGYSGSPRSARYGGTRSLETYLQSANQAVSVIVQVEDQKALDHLPQIASTPGLDGLFIGRADLAVALGAPGSGAAPVRTATEKIAAACKLANAPILAFGSPSEAPWLFDLGVTGMVVGSDQGFLRTAAADILASVRSLSPLAVPSK